MTPLPGATATKPGSATKPFFGIQPVILEPTTGEEITTTEAEGVLCIADSWPGQMRTVYGDHERFVKTYFATTKATTSPATAAAAMPTATTGSPGG